MCVDTVQALDRAAYQCTGSSALYKGYTHTLQACNVSMQRVESFVLYIYIYIYIYIGS